MKDRSNWPLHKKTTHTKSSLIRVNGKFFTKSDFNKLTIDTFDAEIKNKDLNNRSDISGFINDSDSSKKLLTLPTQAESKAEQDRTMKSQTLVFSYFFGNIFLGDHGSQNMFVYQLTFSSLQLQKGHWLYS